MSILDRLLQKFSPPLDSSLIISLTSDISDSDDHLQEIESNLTQTLSSLILEFDYHQITPTTSTDRSPPRDLLVSKFIPSQTLISPSNQIDRSLQPSSSDPLIRHSKPQLSSDQPPDPNQTLIDRFDSIFPALSESIIRRAVSNVSSDPNHFNHILDSLLSTQFEFDHHQQLSLDPPDADRDLKPTHHQAKKLKKQNRSLQKFHLNDVLQRGTQNRYQDTQRPDRPIEVNNAWVTGDSQIFYLSKLLGIETGKIHSIYHRKSCNLVLTLEELLNWSETENRIEISKDPDREDRLNVQLEFLKTVLATHDDETLRRLLIVTDLDPGNAFDLWLFLDDLNHRYGSLHFNQFFRNHHPNHPSPSSSDPTQSSSTSKRLPLAIDSIDGDSLPSGLKASQAQSDPHPIAINQRDHSLKSCSNQLNQLQNKHALLKQRSMSTPQASIVLPNKRAFQKSISALRSEDARQVLDQIKEWELKLAGLVVLDRQRDRNDYNCIDLHGLTKNQAILVTSQHLDHWWSTIRHSNEGHHSSAHQNPFRIITGAGSHSKNSRPALLPAITHLLDQDGWKWKFENSSYGAIGSVLVLGIRKSTCK